MSTKYQLKRRNLEWVDAAEETVILDQASEQYLATNPSGSLLWKALSQGRTRNELAALLIEEFGIDAMLAEADTDNFISELERRGLIEEVP